MASENNNNSKGDDKEDNNNYNNDTNNNNNNNDEMNKDNIRIVQIEDSHLPQLVDVINEAFGSKQCCLCIPGTESFSEVRNRYKKMPDAKRRLGVVALGIPTATDSSSSSASSSCNKEQVLGFAQMTRYGLPIYPPGLHTCQRDEMYLEMMGVSAQARGKGIGTKLLDWCYDTAMANRPEIGRIRLGVLRGNRAIGLYERVGFRTIPSDDFVDECCTTSMICCLMGRPYGMCHEEWGAIGMELVLNRE